MLKESAQAARAIALRHFGACSKVREKGSGQGSVGEADLEIDTMLRERLRAARPEFGWLSEETLGHPATRLAALATFIVDPLDVTRAFWPARRDLSMCWYLRVGRVTAAVVHLSLLDLTYLATAGGGAFLNHRCMMLPPRKGLIGARILATWSQLATANWQGVLPLVEPHFRKSLARRLCLVAEGRFHGAATLHDTRHWDTAAAALIAREAGAVVSDRFGAPLVFKTPKPLSRGLLVGSAGVLADFLKGLQAEEKTFA